ncbi:hypothetical protein OG799_14195 [Micromonospora sp. NBC_00898]|uniref:hypothetical protein n=1 Tax=Micromonospora sp. NBC_00898 TaxID=2975981 RepID=UPI003864CFD4|nr:hypothetical protein OG799_14195 [Micromonospora sp. NBC_00898]
MPRKLMSRSMAVVMAASLALTGCGAESPRPEPAASGASAPTTAPAPEPSPAAPTYKILGKAALTKALLPLNAIPTGYSEDESDSSDSSDKTFCNYRQPYVAKVKVSKSYQKGGGLSAQLILVSLRQYASPAQAKASFDKMAKTLETCRKDTSDGQKVSYALMNLPDVGEKSLGVRIELQGGTALQGFALVGPTLVTTGTAGVMSADADVVADLLGKQVDRYSTAAAG